MKIFIVEDEIPNLRLLSGMITTLRPGWVIAGACDSVQGSVDWLRNNNPDLIFMDVQLADGICFSIFEITRVECPVIFTTAYDNYAVRAFRVNGIDYLLKPVKDSELGEAIQRFEKRCQTPVHEFDVKSMLEAIKSGERKYRNRFLVHGPTSYYKLDVSAIAYFYSTNKVTFAVEYSRKEHAIDFSLEALEEELNPDEFFRINRQTIVHVNSIRKMEDYFNGKLHVTLVAPFGNEFIVSRLRNRAFKTWLGK